LSQSSV